jgi:hypothetical protein
LAGDLYGLDRVEFLHISNNPVEIIDEDFFKGHSSISVLSFSSKRFKIIDPKVLDPLTDLFHADFSENDCTNTEAIINFFDLIQKIKSKCQDPSNMAGNRGGDQQEE